VSLQQNLPTRLAQASKRQKQKKGGFSDIGVGGGIGADARWQQEIQISLAINVDNQARPK
jgi:hypothetical protein